MKDFWDQTSAVEQFCIEACIVIVKTIVFLSLAGCGAVVASPTDNGYDAAIVAIADADPDARPELPDSLTESEDVGAAPAATTLPKVQLFVTDGCPPCVEAKKWLKTSKIPWVQMPRPNPKWCDEAGRGYPAFAWQLSDGSWRYYFGFVDGLAFEAYYRGTLKP